MQRKIRAVGLTVLVIFLAVMFYQVSSRAREAPSAELLTREQIIERATEGLKQPEVIDIRLVFHDEAAHAIGVGEFDYESGFYKKEDPVWILAIRSENTSQVMPDIGQGDVNYTGLIYSIDAASGEAILMATMPDEQFEKRVERMQALPDRDGMLEITPRTLPAIEGLPTPDVPLPKL